jgi:preprotein translocase subunit SecD
MLTAPAAANGRVPGDSEVKYTRDGRPIVMYKRVILTGDHITDSTSSQDEFNRPQVNISLDGAGGSAMSNFTKDNIGKPMATLFVEYKDSGKKDASGKSILAKQEEVITWRLSSLVWVIASVLPVSTTPNEAPPTLSAVACWRVDCTNSDC